MYLDMQDAGIKIFLILPAASLRDTGPVPQPPVPMGQAGSHWALPPDATKYLPHVAHESPHPHHVPPQYFKNTEILNKQRAGKTRHIGK